MSNVVFNIYVADLERYNSGYLVGKWLDIFEYDDVEDLNKAISEILKEHDNEEYAIHDYDCGFDHHFGEYESLQGFIDLKDMLVEDENKTLALMESLGVETVIRENPILDRYILYSEITNEYELGEYHAEFLFMQYNIPDDCDIRRHFDFKSYGESMDSGNGTFTDYGYLSE